MFLRRLMALAQTPDSLMQVTEGTLNAVGYQLVTWQRPAEAAELFRVMRPAPATPLPTLCASSGSNSGAR